MSAWEVLKLKQQVREQEEKVEKLEKEVKAVKDDVAVLKAPKP